MAHSSAARAAVWIYTRALAREWAADGIAVLALDDSGTVPTEQRRPPA
jgi:NAD(P)-dependent dehydrogenase (short-subunit alcohol dehydrogenase family)